ncbi:MAG TPA: STAS domain-containing protein [Limnobacter sp.]|nr:STAS domain-containing protein [Limnobacter sp.]
MITLNESDEVLLAQVQAKVVDAKTAGLVRDTLLDVVPRYRRFILDMHACNLVDSGGLAGMVTLLKGMKANNCELVLCNLNKPVVSLFQLTRMDRLFKIEADLSAAQAFFKGAA